MLYTFNKNKIGNTDVTLFSLKIYLTVDQDRVYKYILNLLRAIYFSCCFYFYEQFTLPIINTRLSILTNQTKHIKNPLRFNNVYNY